MVTPVPSSLVNSDRDGLGGHGEAGQHHEDEDATPIAKQEPQKTKKHNHNHKIINI
jgi:hypothetical protein